MYLSSFLLFDSRSAELLARTALSSCAFLGAVVCSAQELCRCVEVLLRAK